MLVAFLAIIIGLILLCYSADLFIKTAINIAKYFSWSPLLVGILIIGFGTSMPEAMVAITAALQHKSSLAIGNAYGSNIANIGLIIGVSAVLRPLIVHSKVVRQELIILLGISILSLLLLLDLNLSHLDASILIILFIFIAIWMIFNSKKKDIFSQELISETKLLEKKNPFFITIILLFFAIAILLISSDSLVWGAIKIAHHLGVSDLIIGLTIIAIGTSLPELATAIAATRKNETDLVLGNVIGSNIFNTLIVTGLAGIIHPIKIATTILYRDLPINICLTIILLFITYNKTSTKTIKTIKIYHGLFLLTCYFIYLITIIIYK